MARPLGPLSEKRPVTKRLGVYFMGVAIGLVMVGILFQARRAMVQSPQPEPPTQTEPAP